MLNAIRFQHAVDEKAFMPKTFINTLRLLQKESFWVKYITYIDAL